jgi:SulP family sulfate permease
VAFATTALLTGAFLLVLACGASITSWRTRAFWSQSSPCSTLPCWRRARPFLNVPVTLRAQLADSGFERSDIDRLTEFLEKVQVEAGEHLIQQGDEANDLYFVEWGEVTVYLDVDGKQVRLQALGPGTVVGEFGLYLDAMRNASVIADYATTAYRLTRASLFEMKEKEPELAATFHEFMVRLLSERLTLVNRLVEAMLR